MKRNINKRPPASLFGIAVIAVVISLGLAGCPPATESPKVERYSGSTDDGKTYILEITDDSTYVLTIIDSDGRVKSSGTVESATDGAIVLKPESGNNITVTTTDDGQMTGVTVEEGGDIVVTDESGETAPPVPPPETVQPPLLGKWIGRAWGSSMTLDVPSGNTWTATVSGQGSYGGTYTLSGNTATMSSSSFSGSNQTVGTTTVNSDGTITVTLNSNAGEAEGTYIFAKSSGGNSRFAGTWSGSVGGVSMTLNVSLSTPTWGASMAGESSSGIYTVSSSSTATLYSDAFSGNGSTQKIGTATVDGTTMTVTLDSIAGEAAGTYSLTKRPDFEY